MDCPLLVSRRAGSGWKFGQVDCSFVCLFIYLFICLFILFIDFYSTLVLFF